MSLLNEFKLGADPEFVIVNDEHLIRFESRVDRYSPWGLDHSGWVIEPHPKPEFSVRELVKNIKTSLNDFATVAPRGKWRAGAYLRAPERTVTLGGHVHIDKPNAKAEEIVGLDLFTKHLEALDILPQDECTSRRGSGDNYGRYGDIRAEHGHFEYRTFPSWLYSQRVTKLCLAASKLVVVDPTASCEALGSARTASLPKLKAFFERFKGKDDDVDWILSSGMMDKKLTVKPDRDLRDVWSVEPKKETPRWKEQVVATAQTNARIAETTGLLTPRVSQVGRYFMYYSHHPTVPILASDARVPIIFRAPVGEATRLNSGEHAVVVGEIGEGWAINVMRLLWRNQVNGREYRWRLLSNQALNESVYSRLREYAMTGNAEHEGTVTCFEGLFFQPMGAVARELNNDF